MARSLSGSLELLTKSLYFDARTLALESLPRSARVTFVGRKWRCLARMAVGSPAHLRVGDADLQLASISDLGTLQACIVDIHDELVVTGLVNDQPCVVDVGANIGQWTAAFKWLYPQATVLAVEPDPDTHARLQLNSAQLAGVQTRQSAVGSHNGATILYRQALSTMSTTCPTAGDDMGTPVEVPATTLDALLEDHSEVDVLKIDVEGGEMGVLEGSEDVLKRTRVLLVETSLERGTSNALDVLAYVGRSCPEARIVKFGRPLGRRDLPACQDVVIAMR